MNQFCRVLALGLFSLVSAGVSQVHAGCTITAVQAATPNTLNVGTYTATSTPPPATIAVTLTVLMTGNGIGSCQGSIALYKPSPPLQMVRVPPAPVALPYSVTVNGTNAVYFGVSPPPVIDLPPINAPNGAAIGTVTVVLTVTPAQPLAAPSQGNYLDTLILRIFNKQGNQRILAGQTPVVIAAQAQNSCNLASTGTMSLNFSSDVATGIPQGAVQSVNFNVNCTAPSRVQVSGAALVRTPAGGPSGAFDNFINYRAVTNFGNASATLVTNGTSPTTITSPTSSSLVGSNLPVNVDVNLIANRPLLGGGGAYSGVLRITVDPSL
jgi:hypothetical protein